MKKSDTTEQNLICQPRDRGTTGKRTSAAVKGGVKLSPTRQYESAGLLEEHYHDSEVYMVNFNYFNPNAREVLVAASFNDWHAQATPMTNQGEGKWFTQVLLKPGHYEYRLVVDGRWQDDPMAARFVANPFGELNGVLEVRPRPANTGSQPSSSN
jgi:1,4-alpha-glucan branching enzyme